MGCGLVELVDDHYQPPIGGCRSHIARGNQSTLDHFENHASPAMKTLHTSLAFFHPLERRARLLCNFAARCPHIVGQHDHVINPDDAQRKVCACARGALCSCWSIVDMHDGQAGDVAGASRATDEIEVS